MQAGFATLSAGSIRAKNVKNILLKNLLDAANHVKTKARHRHGRVPARSGGVAEDNRSPGPPEARSAADRGLRSACLPRWRQRFVRWACCHWPWTRSAVTITSADFKF